MTATLWCRQESCKIPGAHLAHDQDFVSRRGRPVTGEIRRPKKDRTRRATIDRISPQILRFTDDHHAIVECPECSNDGESCLYCNDEGSVTLIRWHHWRKINEP